MQIAIQLVPKQNKLILFMNRKQLGAEIIHPFLIYSFNLNQIVLPGYCSSAMASTLRASAKSSFFRT